MLEKSHSAGHLPNSITIYHEFGLLTFHLCDSPRGCVSFCLVSLFLFLLFYLMTIVKLYGLLHEL